MLQLKDKAIGLTGSNSMVGRAVARELETRGAHIFPIRHTTYDLTLNNDAYNAIYQGKKNGVFAIIHCAGYNGNIDFNKKHPVDIFHRTTLMALNVLYYAYQAGIKHVVSPLASCAYPDTDILWERYFWQGAPNESVEAHGLAKRNILTMGKQIFKQNPEFKYVSCIFNTCYGPYDSYDENKTKVVGGMIKRFMEAKKQHLDNVVCWGTGQPRRELVYVDDAAKGLVDTLVYYDDPTCPLNIGSGTDVSIKELAETVAEVCGYTGKISWDTNRPNGQMRKLLNNHRMKILLPEREFTPLRDGLTKTIEWYNEHN